jgi:hypothetical protein
LVERILPTESYPKEKVLNLTALTSVNWVHRKTGLVLEFCPTYDGDALSVKVTMHVLGEDEIKWRGIFADQLNQVATDVAQSLADNTNQRHPTALRFDSDVDFTGHGIPDVDEPHELEAQVRFRVGGIMFSATVYCADDSNRHRQVLHAHIDGGTLNFGEAVGWFMIAKCEPRHQS